MNTIPRMDGVQATSSKCHRVFLKDFVNNGNVIDIELPVDALILRGGLYVKTSFNSTGTDVLDVGDPASANRYLNDGNIKAAGVVPLVPTGFVTTPDNCHLRLTRVPQDAAATTGELILFVEWAQPGHSHYTIG